MPALLFSGKLLEINAIERSVLAFFAFCLISSCVYVINDITDCKKDIYHPIKKNRPLAAGLISSGRAWLYSLLLLIISVFISMQVSAAFTLVIALYFIMQLFYSFGLKQMVILDVIIIAAGFVLRAVSGAVALQVPFTAWLVVCIFSLCLFMGFCKRYNETAVLSAEHKVSHRQSLLEYTQPLLAMLITVSATLAIVSFMLYSISERTIASFGTSAFIYTVPVVIYCVFRFAAMSMDGRYDGPADLVIKDVPLISGVVIWIALAIVIVLKGQLIHDLSQNFYR